MNLVKLKIKMNPKMKTISNDYNPKSDDNLIDDDDPKNEDDLKKENYPKMKTTSKTKSDPKYEDDFRQTQNKEDPKSSGPSLFDR